MPTRTVMTFEGGLVEFQVDYDESNRITALRCINDSDNDVIGEVTRVSTGRSAQKTLLAHTTTHVAIPTNAAQRIQFDGFGAHQHFVGLSFRFKG